MDLEQLQPARLPINTLMDVVAARRRGLEMALTLGFPRPDATKIAGAVSELGRHSVLYAKGGVITLIAYTAGEKGLKIIAHNQGPGLSGMEPTLAGAGSTAQQAALSNAKRLMDEFEIRAVGEGATITAIKWLR